MSCSMVYARIHDDGPLQVSNTRVVSDSRPHISPVLPTPQDTVHNRLLMLLCNFLFWVAASLAHKKTVDFTPGRSDGRQCPLVGTVS
jgi:hypothetical protein